MTVIPQGRFTPDQVMAMLRPAATLRFHLKVGLQPIGELRYELQTRDIGMQPLLPLGKFDPLQPAVNLLWRFHMTKSTEGFSQLNPLDLRHAAEQVYGALEPLAIPYHVEALDERLFKETDPPEKRKHPSPREVQSGFLGFSPALREALQGFITTGRQDRVAKNRRILAAADPELSPLLLRNLLTLWTSQQLPETSHSTLATWGEIVRWLATTPRAYMHGYFDQIAFPGHTEAAKRERLQSSLEGLARQGTRFEILVRKDWILQQRAKPALYFVAAETPPPPSEETDDPTMASIPKALHGLITGDPASLSAWPDQDAKVETPPFHPRIGEIVFMPGHGHCKITDIQTRTIEGQQGVFYGLQSQSCKKQSFWVPTSKVVVLGLRPPLTEAQVPAIFVALRTGDVMQCTNHNRALRFFTPSTSSPDLQVVARAHRSLHLWFLENPRQARTLNDLFEKTRQLLSEELRHALQPRHPEVDDQVVATMIQAALNHPRA